MPDRYESKTTDAGPLGQPLEFAFSKRTAKNRFQKAAMTERLSSWSVEDEKARGVPSDELVNVYRRWGEGGFGMILTGNVMLYANQLEAPGNMIVPVDAPATAGDKRFDQFKKLATAAKKEGSLCVAQLSHPGRQVQDAVNPAPISASDVQLTGNVMGMTFAKPRAATKDDIADIVRAFAHAAQYCEAAGFDGVELHGAHGYLLAQFLSTTTNRRQDEYGGSLENRARIIDEIAQAVRRATRPDFVLGIKINSVEFQAEGFTPDEATQLCRLLEAARFDFVELSGGTYESLAFTHRRESSRRRESFFLDFADQIAPALQQTRSYVVGGFKTVGAMVDALQTCDGVTLGRPAAQEPALPAAMLEGRVAGAIRQRFDPDDFGLTNVVAGSQIRQLGRDQQPLDGSDPDVERQFRHDMQTWMQALAADASAYGYVDVVSVAPRPYGAAAADA